MPGDGFTAGAVHISRGYSAACIIFRDKIVTVKAVPRKARRAVDVTAAAKRIITHLRRMPTGGGIKCAVAETEI